MTLRIVVKGNSGRVYLDIRGDCARYPGAGDLADYLAGHPSWPRVALLSRDGSNSPVLQATVDDRHLRQEHVDTIRRIVLEVFGVSQG